jgi:hypothetical protein
METTRQTTERKHGERPFQYSYNPTGRLSQEISANEFTLITGDSFEVGGAYSLHTKKEAAGKYKTAKWWQPVHKNIRVFISKNTLEKLVEKGGTVFKSWEN